MTSILQTVNSAVQKEFAFNSLFREMAKDNLSLAGSYITSAFARSVTNPATSLTLKGRCINLIKASLLLPRAFLLYLPLTNRIAQLGLRFLSPQQVIDFVKSSPYRSTNAELKIRYNTNTLVTFAVEQLLEKNIRKNKEFVPLMFKSKDLLDAYVKLSPSLSTDLISSPEFREDEVKARYSEDTRREFIEGYFQDKIAKKEEFDPSSLNLFDKLGFDSEKCMDIFAKLSPDLNTELVNSSTKEDLLARYSEATRCEFVEDCFKEKIAQQQKITKLHLDLSKYEQTIFLIKLGFTYQECNDICFKFLVQHSEKAKLSVKLKKEVNQYKKTSHN
ncbi:MAG TPA: hypothetical protein VGZ69_04455 [Candidatus Rhabdochlamydia sp.]|jgi:hypothetical protein|nr:hypothetical protein [Candidatus Rhabdochlamydia sp.]